MFVRLVLITTLVVAACGPATESGPMARGPRGVEPTPEVMEQATRQYESLEDAFLEWYYEAYPVRATELGIHRFDDRITELDRSAVQRRIDDVLDWLARLDRIPAAFMEGERRFDRAVLEYGLRAELLSLEEIREWARNPQLYTSTIARGIASIVDREYAAVEDRMESLRARMEASPALLAAARENLRSPPELWTELAIADTRGLIQYLDSDLPAALDTQAGSTVRVEGFEEAREELVASLAGYLQWLEADLLPVSNGEFRLGQYLFLRKLLYEEHVDLSVAELDRLNEEAITEYRARVEAVAREIDPDRTPREIMDSLVQIHPAPDELLPTAREMMNRVRAWVLESGLVPVPTEDVPLVRETPAWSRGSFASMDAPGPFESTGLQAYYNITNVAPDWTIEQQQEHLTYFNYPGLLGVTIHETFPGHYVQLLYERNLSSDLRKVITPRSFVEGWAHYVEQMVLDEGFEADDPAARLGQLRRALQRHGRWYAGLHLHAMGESIDAVVDRFMEIAYFDEFPARREVVRATYDPTYLYYALGRMQILELREDYREHLEGRDETFDLRSFHDRLLELGLPLTLAREALIPSERPEPVQIYRRRR